MKQRRSPVDRRSGWDRRQMDDPGMIELLGVDRRKALLEDRRERLLEQREGWVRVTQWSSVCIDPTALFY